MSSSQMRSDAAETAVKKMKICGKESTLSLRDLYICLMLFFRVMIAFVVTFNI